MQGYLFDDYILLRLSENGEQVWYFLNLNNLDKDYVLNSKINSLDVFSTIFNIILNDLNLNKTYRHLIPTPDERRFKLYLKMIEKIIQKHKIPYTINLTNKGIQLNPVTKGLFS